MFESPSPRTMNRSATASITHHTNDTIYYNNRHSTILSGIIFCGFLYSVFLYEISKQTSTSNGKTTFRKYPITYTSMRTKDYSIIEYQEIENKNKFILTQINERIYSSLVGSFIADAASMGLHLIYDSNKIKDLLAFNNNNNNKDTITTNNNTFLIGSEHKNPEFFDPPSSPIYKYKNGALSPLGDELIILLNHISFHQGFYPSIYSMDSYQSSKNYTGKLNYIMKEFIDKIEEGFKWPNVGSDNKESHGLIKVPLIVARYGGLSIQVITDENLDRKNKHLENRTLLNRNQIYNISNNNRKKYNISYYNNNEILKSTSSELLISKIREAVQVHQKDPITIGIAIAAGLILESIILEKTVKTAVLNCLRQEEKNIPLTVKNIISSTINKFNHDFPLSKINENVSIDKEIKNNISLTGSLLEKENKNSVNKNKKIENNDHSIERNESIIINAINYFGKTSDIISVFQGSLYILLVMTDNNNNNDNYVDGIRYNIVAGGDNCSRGIYLGACLAALGEKLPHEWIDKTLFAHEINENIQKIIQYRNNI